MKKKVLACLLAIGMVFSNMPVLQAAENTTVSETKATEEITVPNKSDLKSGSVTAGTDKTWVYTAEENWEYMTISFSGDTKLSDTETEYEGDERLDYIEVSGNNGYRETFHGSELAGKRLTLPGNTVKIHVRTYGNQSKGFTVSDVTEGKEENCPVGTVTVTNKEELCSTHPAAERTDKTWVYEASKDWDYTAVKFADTTKLSESETKYQDDYYQDYIEVGNDSGYKETYRGSDLAGKTITVPGNVIRVHLRTYSDKSEGFSVTKIVKGEEKDILTGEVAVTDEELFESKHMANAGTDKTWVCTSDVDWDYTALTFSGDATKTKLSTETTVYDGKNCQDYIEITGDDDFSETFYGSELTGRTITVPGHVVKLRLRTYGSSSYGFAVTNISSGKAENLLTGTVAVKGTENFCSRHNAAAGTNRTWVYTANKDQEYTAVTFSGATVLSAASTEYNGHECQDYIEIKNNGSYTERFYGNELAGRTITVPGNVLRVRLRTYSNKSYGFKVTKVGKGDEEDIPSGTVKVTDPAKFESAHNAAAGTNRTWRYTADEAWKYTAITFSKDTKLSKTVTEINGTDFLDSIEISNGGNYKETFYGDELAGKTITLTGNTVSVRLKTYGSKSYGFAVDKVAEVKEEDIPTGTVKVSAGSFSSKHNAAAGTDKTWIYTAKENQEYTAITFSDKTKLSTVKSEYDNDYCQDYIRIYNGSYSEIFYGNDLAGKTVTIPGNSFRISLRTYGSASYGFDVEKVAKGNWEDIPTGTVVVTGTDRFHSKHNAAAGTDRTWTYNAPASWGYTAITFSDKTELSSANAKSKDCITIFNDEYSISFYGDKLRGKTITVPGNTVSVNLTAYGSKSYGFDVVKVAKGSAEDLLTGKVNVTSTANFQSKHTVAAGTDKTWSYTGSTSNKYTAITFSQETALSATPSEYYGGYYQDRITIYNDDYFKTYYGTELKGKTINVPGNKVNINIRAYGNKSYGFAVSKIAQIDTPKQVTGLKCSKNTSSSLTLSWSRIAGVTGYEVYQYKDGNQTAVTRKTTGTSYTFTKLKAGHTYSYAVRAYTTVGKKVLKGSWSSKLTTTTLPSKITCKVTPGSRKVTVKWSKVTGATGYKVYYKTSSNGKWTLLKTTSGTSYTKTRLTKGKTYYFKVVAYRTVNKKTYTGDGATKSAKVK